MDVMAEIEAAVEPGRAGDAETARRRLAELEGFYPSLHLNLGDDHRRLGDLTAARRHLELGRAALPALPDDGYGGMIRHGLEVLAERLGEA